MQIRALMDALHDLKYDKVKIIKVVKAKTEDQGIRTITRYL